MASSTNEAARRWDWAVTASAFALSVSVALAPHPVLASHHGVTLAIQLLLCTTLLWRRTRPVAVLAAVTVVSALIALAERAAPGSVFLLGPSGDVLPWLPVAAPYAVYAAAAYAYDRRPAYLLTGVLTLLAQRPWDPSPGLLSRALVLVPCVALLGLYLAARRRLVRALTERADRAEREQHLLAERARVEERSRLAAEMHDVVTHRVTLMVLQAGALRMTAREAPARAAAEEIRETGHRALEELRDLVGLLRRAPADAPVAFQEHAGGPPDFTELISNANAAGTPVRLSEQGDRAAVSPVVSGTLYRVVQESLTNVRKHAPGASVEVRVRYHTDRIRLSIGNGPAARRPAGLAPGPGPGTGLLGLRQRVELVGGTLHTGPTPQGGFRVAVSLPAYLPAPESTRQNDHRSRPRHPLAQGQRGPGEDAAPARR